MMVELIKEDGMLCRYCKRSVDPLGEHGVVFTTNQVKVYHPECRELFTGEKPYNLSWWPWIAVKELLKRK